MQVVFSERDAGSARIVGIESDRFIVFEIARSKSPLIHLPRDDRKALTGSDKELAGALSRIARSCALVLVTRRGRRRHAASRVSLPDSWCWEHALIQGGGDATGNTIPSSVIAERLRLSNTRCRATPRHEQ